ncbi:tubulin polyglutamylase TTLL5 [Nilaparvata lugens]|uniref:tubulin polyglutamylase TTLL5 n=1 Tax=Nilaparvata lugens TaxID=108931 RepID=UPI00193C9190|nr:tubulin polyglutamylase TTLL5 [Nilaparvata lugens]
METPAVAAVASVGGGGDGGGGGDDESATAKSWTISVGGGGSSGASTPPVLVFRCSALSQPPAPHSAPAHLLHMTYKTQQTETKLLAAMLAAHGLKEVGQDVSDFNLLWTGIHPKPDALRSLAAHQRVNHFPRSYELTRKDRLYKNIEKMQHTKGVKHFDFIPQTFIMPGDFRDLMTCHYRQRGPWIVKPVASSRGRGIYIVNSPDEVPVEESVVVAKYIDRPLLIAGHKCDLRLYVAVTSYDPLLIYMYEEGLVRLATVKYDSGRKHLWNPCMHLCNYSINKHHSDYIKSDDPEAEDVGHKWTLSALLRHLRKRGVEGGGGEGGVDTGQLMQRIEEVVVKAIMATAPSIVAACQLFVPHPNNCFELYGFDILIDYQLKPWLLEVNLSPSLGCDSPLDTRLKSAMLADLLTLVGVPALDPVTRPANHLRHQHHRHSTLPERRHLTKARRVQSADSLPSVRKQSANSHNSSSLSSSRLNNSHHNNNNQHQHLTGDVVRMIRNARAQFERRGGFIRIFPSPESWKRYSQFLDPVTGVPCLPPGSASLSLLANHNLNLILHQRLFAGDQLTAVSSSSHLPAVVSSEKLYRYERALSKGHRASLDDKNNTNNDISTANTGVQSAADSAVLRQEVLACLQDGYKLSQVQARQAFGCYLARLLGRMSGGGAPSAPGSRLDESHSELVLRFLKTAGNNLRLPFHLKAPSKNLQGKDRIAVIAKQLNDFIYVYNRETDSIAPSIAENRHHIPNRLFSLFLPVANESDLEEVLTTNARLYKCAQVFLGRCGPSPRKLHTLGLLQSIGNGHGPQDKVFKSETKIYNEVHVIMAVIRLIY